jgi:hypothetical protein
MADKDTPNRSANNDKAERERWSSEQGVIPNSESSTERGQDAPRRYDQPVDDDELPAEAKRPTTQL